MWWIQLSEEGDDGDAGATEADVLVFEAGDAGCGSELLADKLAEYAGAGAVQDTDFVDSKLQGVVYEKTDTRQCLVGPHASDVEFILEFELSLPAAVG